MLKALPSRSFLFVIPEGNLLFVRSHMHYTNDENALVR